MPMRLVRRPRNLRRVAPAVRAEVTQAYKALGQEVEQVLLDKVSNWDTKPKFIVKVKVNTREWLFQIDLDKRATGSKYFDWADQGTGERGGGEAYSITPKKAGGMLVYEVPSFPKTQPTGPINQAPPGVYRVPEVIHPGIWPRNWTGEVVLQLRDRRRPVSAHPPGFRAVTEAAIKRAFRKMGIY